MSGQPGAEITKELFRAIVPTDEPCLEVKELEFGRVSYYRRHGVLIMEVESFMAGVRQYYVLDINA